MQGALARIGVDLGGTKIEAIALGGGGEELARRRIPTPVGDYDATVRAIRDLALELQALVAARNLGLAGIGIGIPGAISPATGLVKNANSTWLIGRPLDRDLALALDRPIRLANDADCFAISEATDGAAAGAETVFGVIIGTGVGGGVVVRGRLVRGANAITGEWGHNPLPRPREGEHPGPPCYCGRHGCTETFLSGPGMARDYRAATGAELDAPSIVARAESGEPAAEAALARYEDRLARGLAAIINLLDPHVIVLGGGMSRIARLYQSVPRLWGAYVFSDRVDTRLVPPKHGDSSGVRGAAWLWPSEALVQSP
jgi:fructokinase